jgi:hypothetical protein
MNIPGRRPDADICTFQSFQRTVRRKLHDQAKSSDRQNLSPLGPSIINDCRSCVSMGQHRSGSLKVRFSL